MISIIKEIKDRTNLSEQEAWWMLEAITQKDKASLLYAPQNRIITEHRATINNWILQITENNMPLAYLIGSVPFLDLTIKVKPPILIPRQETEEWVNNAIEQLKPLNKSIQSILDIGTGSGCIALAFAKNFPNAHITAADINPLALQLARYNAQHNNISNISFVESDTFNNISSKKCFDIIVSNPPYINPEDKTTMMPQVIEWESHAALFAEDNGLQITEQIIQHAPKYLCKNSTLPVQLILEHDHGQQNHITQHAQKHNFDCVAKKDSFNKYRTVWLSLQNIV
ncbi:MAG: protein-(glutamine-N5) methyltransferase, release factor-specific [Epsilonproteobacteria bacterium]|nr:protein-(glutamine-N5) methyltransferase, release factor-specific [Campylobacterota bacterium]|tara:strand:+ start:62 stop:913 length:852 start_codon:yes stop_codon:yes gene_type:complete